MSRKDGTAAYRTIQSPVYVMISRSLAGGRNVRNKVKAIEAWWELGCMEWEPGHDVILVRCVAKMKWFPKAKRITGGAS